MTLPKLGFLPQISHASAIDGCSKRKIRLDSVTFDATRECVMREAICGCFDVRVRKHTDAGNATCPVEDDFVSAQLTSPGSSRGRLQTQSGLKYRFLISASVSVSLPSVRS